MRSKRRYLAFEALGEVKFGRDAILREVLNSHLMFAGEKAFHMSSPWMISFDEETQRGIIRTNLEGLNDLRASLAMVTRIGGQQTILRTLGVSGTIRACEDRFIRKSGASVLERVEKRSGEEDPEKLGRMAQIRSIVPGSKLRVSHKEFKLKQVFDDGRVDLTSDKGSFGFTILDLLGSNLGNEE